MTRFLTACAVLTWAVGGVALFALRSDIQIGIAVTAFAGGAALFGIASNSERLKRIERATASTDAS